MTALSDRLICLKESSDERFFRDVLGRYPTGVSVVTSVDEQDHPVGMVVGSFTSVSLDPPLVAYMPSRDSSSYAILRKYKKFCVNVLSDDQEDVCRAFATRKGAAKFDDVTWTASPLGSPMIDGAVAWVDCSVVDEMECGDHYIVIGEVESLAVGHTGVPLIFHAGGYGSFSPRSRIIPISTDLIEQITVVDAVRPAIEELVARLGMECAVMVRQDDFVVRVASAGAPNRGTSPIQVGQRLPFRAPLGSLFVAWEPEHVQLRWIDRGFAASEDQSRAAHLAALASVRRHGWLLSLQSAAYRQIDRTLVELPDGPERADLLRRLEPSLGGAQAYDPGPLDSAATYNVRSVSVPLRDADDRVILYFSLFGFEPKVSGADVLAAVEELRRTVNDIGQLSS